MMLQFIPSDQIQLKITRRVHNPIAIVREGLRVLGQSTHIAPSEIDTIQVGLLVFELDLAMNLS
ncbi:hypothetical protein D3C84_1304260 [compost metagenome]